MAEPIDVAALIEQRDHLATELEEAQADVRRLFAERDALAAVMEAARVLVSQQAPSEVPRAWADLRDALDSYDFGGGDVCPKFTNGGASTQATERPNDE